MAGINNRVPSDSGWEKLRGPATGNVPDTGIAPVPKQSPLSKFEAVDPTKHQARFSRTHSATRKNDAGTGSASFAAQKESRGIKPAPALTARGNSPKRTKGPQTKPLDAEKPGVLS
jgi:hypothetical protein